MKFFATIVFAFGAFFVGASEENHQMQMAVDGQVELYEAINTLHERLDQYERVVPTLVDDVRTEIRYLHESLGGQHMANYNMIDARFRTIELLLGLGNKQGNFSASLHVEQVPQLFMAPLLRYIRPEDLRVKLVDDMEASGLTGLHLVIQTDWFDLDGPLDFEKMGVKDSIDPETFALIEDLWHRLQQRDPSYHLHVWLWGDSDWHLNPIKLQGPFGSMEQMVYREINQRFSGFRNLTFGVGWDCHEWLTREHLQQIVDMLELPVAARGLTYDQYNDIADIPSIEQKFHTTEELAEFRARYPRDKYPLIFSSDRCRQYTAGQKYNTGTGTWEDPERHFTRERQQRVHDAAVEQGVTVILGKLGPGLEDAGSMRFSQPF